MTENMIKSKNLNLKMKIFNILNINKINNNLRTAILRRLINKQLKRILHNSLLKWSLTSIKVTELHFKTHHRQLNQGISHQITLLKSLKTTSICLFTLSHSLKLSLSSVQTYSLSNLHLHPLKHPFYILTHLPPRILPRIVPSTLPPMPIINLEEFTSQLKYVTEENHRLTEELEQKKQEGIEKIKAKKKVRVADPCSGMLRLEVLVTVRYSWRWERIAMIRWKRWMDDRRVIERVFKKGHRKWLMQGVLRWRQNIATGSFRSVVMKMEFRILRHAFLRWGKEILRKHSLILKWTKNEVTVKIKKFKADRRLILVKI
jgi:hypothetical protein